MLCELRIRNLAIVEELLFEPKAGLNVLSGETGAGKSILVEAIELLLGGKAAPDLIRTGADTLRVDGVFQFDTDDFFRRRGLDLALEEGTLVISRELGRNGRSRITLNNEPATLARLRAVGERLADLHGQHEHQALLRPETHVEVLDRYGLSLKSPAAGGGLNPIEQYRLERGQWLELRRKLDELETRQGNVAERRAQLEQATKEIRAAGLKPDEESALRAERQVIQHAARLADGVGAVVDDLAEGDAPMLSRLGHAARQLAQAAQIDPSLGEAAAVLEEARVALTEQARLLAGYREGLQFDPDRAEWIENRLAVIGRLKKKHGGTEAEIVARGVALATELAGLADEGVLLERLGQEAARAAHRMLARGRELTTWRRDVADRLLKAAGLELASLGMGKAALTARFAPLAGVPAAVGGDPDAERAAADAAGERGLDQVEFFLAANPGEEARPLARVASGGELSRVMLAMKTVLRGVDPMPILLFDEVDAGIGGAVASAVGERLAELAVGRQLLVITHLPMVASQADHHFRVQKSVKKGRTVTEVRRLEPDEREEELARMLAGAQAGAEAREAARALLAGGRKVTAGERGGERRRGGA